MLIAVVFVLLTAVVAAQEAGAPGLLALAAVIRETRQLVQTLANEGRHGEPVG